MNEQSHTTRNAVIIAVLVALALAAAAVVGFAGSGGASVAGRAQSGSVPASAPSSTASSGSSSTDHSSATPSDPSSVHRHATGHLTSSSPPPTSPSHHRTPSTSVTPLRHSIPLDWRTSARLRGPEAYDGFCPATLEYTATITVNHTPADVTYIWNDGTATAPVTVHVTHSPFVVTRSLRPSDSLTGTLALNVLAPEASSSATLHLNVVCIGVSVGHASTNPPAYTGDCSRGITFTTSVQVTVTNGPVLLHYQWVRSDGAAGAVSTAYFGPGTSTQTLTTAWYRTGSSVAGGPEDASEQLWILDGSQPVSNVSNFSVWCV